MVAAAPTADPRKLTIVLASAAQQTRTATVTVLPDGSGTAETHTVELPVEPRTQVLFRPSAHVADAAWLGATVEVDGADVVVEQLITAAHGGVGRSPCSTRTAQSWVVSHGATRAAVEGERFVVMLLNPFPDVAVADIELVADVGRDAVEGLVVPPQRVVAVDVTSEITVASEVAAYIDVVSGRVAASWIQIADGELAGRGAHTAPATAGAAVLWHLPVTATGEARRDVVAVSNPSPDQVAEVDLEILAELPGVQVNPIEITVRPRRTALVDLSEQDRLDGLGAFSVVVRSLGGVPVTASVSSVSAAPESVDGAPPEPGVVEGSSATLGADAAARRWLVAAEVLATDDGTSDGTAYDGSSALSVVNPSQIGIAQVAVSVDGEQALTVEIGPGRVRRIPLQDLGSGTFMVEVDSSAPVVVGRQLVGLTSRTASLGVAVSEPVPLAEIR